MPNIFASSSNAIACMGLPARLSARNLIRSSGFTAATLMVMFLVTERLLLCPKEHGHRSSGMYKGFFLEPTLMMGRVGYLSLSSPKAAAYLLTPARTRTKRRKRERSVLSAGNTL